MTDSKTIKTINEFCKILEKDNLTKDDKFFVSNIEIDLAKSIIQEFGNETSKKLANVILSVVE